MSETDNTTLQASDEVIEAAAKIGAEAVYRTLPWEQLSDETQDDAREFARALYAAGLLRTPLTDAAVIRVWTRRVRSELDATNLAGIRLGEDYLEGVYNALQQADDHAARLINDHQGTFNE